MPIMKKLLLSILTTFSGETVANSSTYCSLDVQSTTITNNGVLSTAVETHYVSFITATPTINGVAAGSAVIAGVIIAPALVGTVQTVADAAAGKTVQQIAQQLTTALGFQKAAMTAGDIQLLSRYILNAVAAAAALEGAKVLVSAYWTGATAPLTATTNTMSSTSSTQTSSRTSTGAGGVGQGGSTVVISNTDSTIEPTITAIMKTPYPGWQTILAMDIVGSQVTLSDTTSQPSSSLTTSSPTSIDCSKVTNVPGKCGTPGCAYVIASDLGSAAKCSNDYCNCGGNVAPLMTETVSGSMRLGCGYTAVPTCQDCNAATCGTWSTTAPAAYPTSTEQCRKAASNPGKAAVESTVKSTAQDFCTSFLHGTTTIPNGMSLQQYNKVYDGVSYYYGIGWDSGYFNASGCKTAPPQPPPSQDECVSLLYNNWENCKSASTKHVW
jgi:hypothetical protein